MWIELPSWANLSCSSFGVAAPCRAKACAAVARQRASISTVELVRSSASKSATLSSRFVEPIARTKLSSAADGNAPSVSPYASLSGASSAFAMIWFTSGVEVTQLWMVHEGVFP